jgi:hypothetical protein
LKVSFLQKLRLKTGDFAVKQKRFFGSVQYESTVQLNGVEVGVTPSVYCPTCWNDLPPNSAGKCI